MILIINSKTITSLNLFNDSSSRNYHFSASTHRVHNGSLTLWNSYPILALDSQCCIHGLWASTEPSFLLHHSCLRCTCQYLRQSALFSRFFSCVPCAKREALGFNSIGWRSFFVFRHVRLCWRWWHFWGS
jgi:hypothetical protein